MRSWLPALVCLLLCPLAAQGWNADSHRLTGLIARRLLADDPALLASVDAVLAELRSDRHRGLVDATTWMDDTARRGVDDHWHYIDLAFDGVAPTFDASWSAQQDREQAPWALDRARAAITARAADRPQALARLLHLVGDLHQPLHCAERSADRGGNTIQVTNYQFQRDGQQVTGNLHTCWDWAAGLVVRNNLIVYDRDLVPRQEGQPLSALMAAAAPSREAASQLDSRVWAQESYLAACTAVYGRSPVNQGTSPVTLSSEYIDRARDLAQTRPVLAGYRLAAQLRAMRTALVGRDA